MLFGLTTSIKRGAGMKECTNTPSGLCDFRLTSLLPKPFLQAVLKPWFLLPFNFRSTGERIIIDLQWNYCLHWLWRIWMSLTLCSQTVSNGGSALLSLKTTLLTIIACEYWGLICMYSNSLYIREGNLKYKTIENKQLNFPDYFCTGMLLMLFRNTQCSISFLITYHFKK